MVMNWRERPVLVPQGDWKSRRDLEVFCNEQRLQGKQVTLAPLQYEEGFTGDVIGGEVITCEGKDFWITIKEGKQNGA